jgi:hypothetical protein
MSNWLYYLHVPCLPSSSWLQLVLPYSEHPPESILLLNQQIKEVCSHEQSSNHSFILLYLNILFMEPRIFNYFLINKWGHQTQRRLSLQFLLNSHDDDLSLLPSFFNREGRQLCSRLASLLVRIWDDEVMRQSRFLVGSQLLFVSMKLNSFSNLIF